uniref:16S rRNA (uracil(1498)-N(3))-methyltransferase n=1 Tax=Kalanchoe fedtschenkoi TaxID=63787 RepID=A0A7N0TNL0_KALFE
MGRIVGPKPKPNTLAAPLLTSLDYARRRCNRALRRQPPPHPMLTSLPGPPFPRFALSCRNTPTSDASNSNQSRGGLPRFFSDVLPPAKGGVVRIKGDEFVHMTKVLRLAADDRVELFNGRGGLVEGCIQRIEHGGLNFVALEDPKLVPPQATQWHVYAAFGTLKGGRADWLLEKCTELGACSVTPLLTERCPSISDNRMDRLERVILAASKQCQRLHGMALNAPLKVSSLLPLVAESELSLIAVAGAAPAMSVFASSPRRTSSALIIVGPEGDFTDTEVNALTEAGAAPVGLGLLRLRVETATIALLSAATLWSDSQLTAV